MPDNIYIGNFGKGLQTNPLPFNLDNDAFPTLFNFYSWRKRIKRKRGTLFLGRLQRQILSILTATPPLPWQYGQLDLVAGAGNLITGFSLETGSSITPGTINVTVGSSIYTDLNQDGTLQGTPSGSGTINYATGAITIVGGGVGPLTGTFSYFPSLPVMGLEDYIPINAQSDFPLSLSFDQSYAYQINQTSAIVNYYSVSYYKASNNPVYWTGQNYQQFWSTNYANAFWATNNNPGMQFETIATITVGNPTTITTTAPHGLITNDWVWFNEITGADANLLNMMAFQITYVSATSFTVAVDTTGKTINNSGIFQTLTATSPTSTGDGIKWYDGDMTNKTGLPVTNTTGWVNFAPPLTALTVSIDFEPAATYYLVGATSIVPFKDRLLFFAPWIQTSTGVPIQLIDTVIWSWNGTPYYANPVPQGQTSDPSAYYVDQTGKGGYIAAGIDQKINTVTINEDVLLVGFSNRQTRFVYTGNDINPFLFFSINGEYGSNSTFSGITMDRGGFTFGTKGIIITAQNQCERIDIDIPDTVFEIQNLNNGVQRVNAVRDFFKEWIYFTYPLNAPGKYDDNTICVFPLQTLLYNYREDTWALFYKNFTSQGTYRKQTYYTWATLPFKTWSQWREPWNSGSTSALFPSVIGGTPQGYVLIKGEGTGEGVSGYILAIADNGNGYTRITSNNHCVSSSNPNTGVGDYLVFQGCIGSTFLNMQIGQVRGTADANTFDVDIPFQAGTYLGLGQFSRLSQPILQTKQFPFYWDQGKQVRLAAQKYLLDRTANGQVTVNINLSQDPNNAYNSPKVNVPPNGLVYSQLMYTCPESTNIGLTPANTNLQMPTAANQYQIWHRFNTSLIGDTFQVGITLSDDQMRNLTLATSEVALHAMHFVVQPSSQLA